MEQMSFLREIDAPEATGQIDGENHAQYANRIGHGIANDRFGAQGFICAELGELLDDHEPRLLAARKLSGARLDRGDLSAGVNLALAAKIASLAKRIGLELPCAICGGGALNQGLTAAVEKELGIKLLVPPEPRTVTALGAAIQAYSGAAA